jgi:hypothetical protein
MLFGDGHSQGQMEWTLVMLSEDIRGYQKQVRIVWYGFGEHRHPKTRTYKLIFPSLNDGRSLPYFNLPFALPVPVGRPPDKVK